MLTLKSETNAARECITQYSSKFTDIERWRMLIQIGDVEEVRSEASAAMENNIPNPKFSDINFSLGNFDTYVRYNEDKIKSGKFNLKELTRYFYSLYKTGEDVKCKNEYIYLRRRFSWDAKKRAIIA